MKIGARHPVDPDLQWQEHEIRLECLKLALGLPQTHGSPLPTADSLARWVLTGELPVLLQSGDR